MTISASESPQTSRTDSLPHSPNNTNHPSRNWRSTVDRFIRDTNLSEDEQRAIQLGSLDDFVGDLQDIELSKLRKSRINKYMQKAKPFLESIQRFSSALNIYSMVARDLSSFYDDLVDFFIGLDDAIGRLHAYEALFKRSKRFNSALCSVFEGVLDICFWLRSQFRSKTRTITRIVFTNSVKRDAEVKISNFKAMCIKTESEAQLAGAQNADVFQKETTKSIQRMLASQHFEGRKADAFMQNALIKEFHEKLAPLSIAEYLETLQRKRHQGTCSWVLSSESFKFLLSEEAAKSPRFSWITGSPGVGKTYITAFIIEKLEKVRQVAYFFCDTTDVSKRNPLNIWRTMAWQLISKATAFIGEAMRLVSSAEITTKLLKKLMRLVLQPARPSYLIIDGLDEYDSETQQEVVEFLGDLAKDANVLLMSRRNAGIESALQELEKSRKVSRVRISASDTQNDIEQFVRHEAEKLKIEDPLLFTKLVGTIGAKAEGMFLYAKLALKDINQTDTDDERHAILEQLPEGIDSLYSRSMHNINAAKESRRKRVIELLRWVTFATRPMTLDELAVALAITPNEEAFRRSNKPNVERMFFDFCTSLLELDEFDSTLKVVHATAKEFLLQSLPHSPNFNPEDSHAWLSSICLTNLNYDRDFVDREGVDTSNIPPEEVWPWFDYLHPPYYLHLEDHPFLQYSVANWIFHLVQTTRSTNINRFRMDSLDALKSLLLSEQGMLKWLELFHFEYKVDLELSRSSSDIFDAWLLHSENRKLRNKRSSEKDKNEDVEANGDPVGDALTTFAFTFMSFPMIDTSEADKASRDASVFFSQPQLDYLGEVWVKACRHLGFSGSKGILRWRRWILVEYSPRKPLHLAAYFNYINFIDDQLRDGENVDLQDTQDRGPLDQACWGESLDAAKLLVNSGADINRTPRFTYYDGSNPLVSAVVDDRTRQLRSRNYPLARFMLEIGAKVGGDVSPLNPLHAMFDWFQETPDELSTVSLILSHCRSVETVLEAPNPYTGILPLCVLTRNNLPKTTTLYCERHSNPRRLASLPWGADAKTALHEACYHPRCLTGDTLLKLGIDVNTKTAVSRLTPLHIAAASRSDMLPRLLKAGADPSNLDASGRTPLHLAAENDWPEGISELLRQGVDINAADDEGRTPIDLAVANQSGGALKTLWDAGGQSAASRDPLAIPHYPQTPTDIYHVYYLLRCAFRLREGSINIILKCLDEAEYWLCQTSKASHPMVVMVADCGRPYMVTRPMVGHQGGPIRKMRYKIECRAREGPLTAHIPIRRSWTWFDLAKRESQVPSDALGQRASTTFSCAPPPLMQGRACLVENSVDTEDKQVHEDEHYTADAGTSDVALWLSKVNVGESLCLVPMARWPDRVNTTLSATVEVSTSPLPRQPTLIGTVDAVANGWES